MSATNRLSRQLGQLFLSTLIPLALAHTQSAPRPDKTFTIIARNNSAKNIYIQSATLNDRPWDKSWFDHADIVSDGGLVLTMGPLPNKKLGKQRDCGATVHV